MKRTICKINRKSFWSLFLAAALVACSVLPSGLSSSAQPTEKNGLIYFEDDFNRADGEINGDNGWISVSRQVNYSHIIKDGVLNAEDFKYFNAYSGNGECTAVTKRPMSEAALNQRVSVDIVNIEKLSNHSSANVHLRVMASSGTNNAGVPNSVFSYYAEVTYNSLKIRYTDASCVARDISSAELYNIKYGDKYRLEFTAEGIYPTKLTATLWDITDNTVAATVTAKDDKENLQLIGTAGLSARRNNAGQTTALFDNFKYEQIDDLIISDSFDRSGDLGNEWKRGNKASGSLTNGALNIKTVNYPEGDRNLWISDSSFMRPIGEKALNQLIDIEFDRGSDSSSKGDMGAVIIARAQSDAATDANCYRLSAVMGYGSPTAWNGRIILQSGNNEIINTQVGGMNPKARYRMQLNVTSTSETETQLVITLYIFENGNWKRKFQKKTTDTNGELQNPGTAGFSVYDKWRGSVNIYNFNYSRLPVEDFAPLPEDDKIPAYYKDDFSTENGNIHGKNGWIDSGVLLSNKNLATLQNGALVINNITDDLLGTSVKSKIMRPLSEASLNQRVSVDILNLGEIKKAEIDLRIKDIASTNDMASQQAFYTVEVTKEYIRICTAISWVSGKLAGTEYKYIDGHIYRVIATAQGSIPTVITAKLYDVSDSGKEVASVVCSDETLIARNKRTAQIPGTVGVTGCGEVPVVLDNFVYEQIDTVVCHDSFNRKNGQAGNGWVAGPAAGGTAISSAKLEMQNNGNDDMWDAAFMRPVSEAVLNQSVGINFERPETDSNLSEPIVFARAITSAPVTVGASKGFAAYYAKLAFTGDWSTDIEIYKVGSDGAKTLLSKGSIADYGKKSDKNTHLVLLAEGKSPTKLTVMFYTDVGAKLNMLYNATVYDSQPELQTAGTAGVSYTSSKKSFTIKKFSYLNMEELPNTRAELPDDLQEDYMAYFSGTVKSGEFGQWVELDPGKEYIYTVKWKALTNSGGFGARLLFQPYDWGPVSKYVGNTDASDIISNDYNADTCIQTIKFKIPKDACIKTNGKVNIRAIIHEGGIGTFVYATDFRLYESGDSEKTNLLVNPNFKKGLFGWAGNGVYSQGVSDANVLVSPGSGEVQLVKYDPVAFIRDDSEKYFDDGDWAKEFTDGADVSAGSRIKGSLCNEAGKPLSGITVMLDFGTMKTVTDKNGNFEFENVPPESYFISIALKNSAECDFEEMLEVEENKDLFVKLIYCGDNSELFVTEIAKTGDTTLILFPVLSLLAGAAAAFVLRGKIRSGRKPTFH